MTDPFSRSTDAWPETYTKSPALIAGLKGKTDFAPVVIILKLLIVYFQVNTHILVVIIIKKLLN